MPAQGPPRPTLMLIGHASAPGTWSAAWSMRPACRDRGVNEVSGRAGPATVSAGLVGPDPPVVEYAVERRREPAGRRAAEHARIHSARALGEGTNEVRDEVAEVRPVHQFRLGRPGADDHAGRDAAAGESFERQCGVVERAETG